MKGETVDISNYIANTCSCQPGRYEDQAVCATGSRWDPNTMDTWGTISQCQNCPYRLNIPSVYNTNDLNQVQLRKDIRVTELELAYYSDPRVEF